jgi:hypothetical protein
MATPGFAAAGRPGAPRFSVARRLRTPRFPFTRRLGTPRFPLAWRLGAPRFPLAWRLGSPRFSLTWRPGTPRFSLAARALCPGLARAGRLRSPRLVVFASGFCVPRLARSRRFGAPGPIALRLIARRPRPFGTMLLFEAIARILVRATGPPVRAPLLAGEGRTPSGRAFCLRRLPQLAACEPLHHDILIGTFQLRDGRQQLLLIAGAKRRRFAVDQNGPVSESWRHRLILEGTDASVSRRTSCV